ncbi:hypothetical protein SAMN05892883_3808 [Jatrophihabitans sp. GAS493]|nr:hypothetical protein SAMN05892883_3808 [Jatrophihabitans sp. GAS493]
MPLWSALGLVLAAPALTWWAIGPIGRHWPDHEFGPYHVPLGLERTVGVAAVVIVAAAVVGIAGSYRGHRSAERGPTRSATALLAAAGALVAAAWREETAGVVGANIGGGLLLLVGPIAIAALLVAAVRLEHRARGVTMRHPRLLICLAALTAPVLFVVPVGLTSYDQTIGVISDHEYATPQPGDAHSEVRERLGRPLREPVDWLFAPTPSETACEYYEGPSSGIDPTIYQFCYRDELLVSKQTSHGPH